MIIECGNCGAPLDVKEGKNLTRCAYCNSTSRVGTTKTIAAVTPQGWKPPQEWRPPEGVKADPNQVLKLGRSITSLVTWIVVIVGLLGTVIPGAVIYAASQSDAARSVSAAMDAVAQNVAQTQVDDALKKVQQQLGEAQKRVGGLGAPGLNLLTTAGAQEALAAYKSALGGSLQITQLVLHDTHSSLEARSPKNPKHLDAYRYRAGVVSDPEPVRLSGGKKANLAPFLFDPEKTALTDLDALKTTALGKLAYEQATISHVIAERSRGKTVIRIYGRSPRESGYVQFDDRGKVVRVAR